MSFRAGLRAIPRAQRHFSTSLPRYSGVVDLSYDMVPAPDGSTRHPLLLMHGLYGSKTNWRGLSKRFARTLGVPVYVLDLRNHGASPHAEPADYSSMADDVLHLCETHGLHDISLLGHSMGGKVAMALALRDDLPTGLLHKLIVEDVAPQISSRVSKEFIGYAEGMRALAEKRPQSRKEADELMLESAPDPAVRAFLLTNLTNDGPGTPLRWRIPHFMIEESTLEEIGNFPHTEESGAVYKGDTLFLKGAKSRYLSDERTRLVKHFFPNARIESLDTGHWLHAEKPGEFVHIVSEFIRQ